MEAKKLAAKELRIGNYVFGNYIEETEDADIKETCVCMIDILDSVGYTEYRIWGSSIEDKGKLIEEWESFSPIPLTEEWLLKFGFEFGIKLQDFVKGKHQFIELNRVNGYFSENGIFYFGFNTKILYIHQLQNLYFALTGEELT